MGRGADAVLSEPVALLLRSKPPHSTGVNVPEPNFKLPSFLSCFVVTSFGTLTKPVPITGHVVSIEATQRHVLGCA